MFGMGFMEITLVYFQIFAGISGGQMPIGVPPRAEMPVMSQVAPEKCFVYMSFAGQDTADPNATNLSEQFMAQPQVKALIESIDAEIQRAVNKDGDEGKTDSEASVARYAMAKQFLTCPWCMFVSDVRATTMKEPPAVSAGMVFSLGEQKEAFEKNIETLLKDAEISDKVKTVTIDGKKFRQMTVESPKPILFTWGVVPGKDNEPLFLFAVGEGTLEAMLERMKTSAPAGPSWLVELKKQLPIERRATVTYIDLAKVTKLVLPLVAKESPFGEGQVEKIAEALGVGNLKVLQTSTGLDKTGMVDLIRLETTGPMKGLVTAWIGSPLKAEDLAAIPADTNLLGAVNFDLVKFYAGIQHAVETIEPRMRPILDLQAQQMAQATGFESFEKLLGSIGQTWTVHNSPSEGGVLLTGLTVSVKVNESFAQTRAALETMLEMVGEQDPDSPKLMKKEYKGAEVCYLQFPAPEDRFPGRFPRRFRPNLPFSPAWCVKDGRLFLSLVPQNIKAILERDAVSFKSIVTMPEVASALAKNPAPVSLSYTDPKPFLQVLYPILPYLSQSLPSILPHREMRSVTFDTFNLPSLPTILPYAKPMVRTMRSTESSIMVETHSTLPGINASSGVVPMYLGVMVPSISESQKAAQRMQSMNNMKQIFLGVLNYECARKIFPPAYSVDENGKPLLSWRVQLLPYLEEKELYEQFHLDEPWDSEHNKKLIPLMPAVFRSARSKAEPGKTTYLTIRTKDSAFPGTDKVGFRGIKDGSSNTAAVVEVEDALAVTWTKPDDFVPDEKDPAKGLRGVYKNCLILGMCDGSVRTLSDSIDKDVLRTLFTRAGNEPVMLGPYEYR